MRSSTTSFLFTVSLCYSEVYDFLLLGRTTDLRVVMREGIVRGTFSIQAPTHFELISPDTRRTIDYLHTTSPSLDLSQYKGLRIVVSGEEGLDERWGNTPVITIQKIQVVE